MKLIKRRIHVSDGIISSAAGMSSSTCMSDRKSEKGSSFHDLLLSCEAKRKMKSREFE